MKEAISVVFLEPAEKQDNNNVCTTIPGGKHLN